MAHLENPGQVSFESGPMLHRVVPTSTTGEFDHSLDRIVAPVSQTDPNAPQQHDDLVTDRDVCNETEPLEPKSRLIVAVDFGTTYSSVSYAKIDPGVDSTRLPVSEIHCIDSYGRAVGHLDPRGNARAENVPTKLLYLGSCAPTSESAEQDIDDYDSGDECLTDMAIQPIQDPALNERGRRKRGRKPAAASPKQPSKLVWSRTAGTKVHWGYDVQQAQEDPYDLINYPHKEAVELIKVTLGEDCYADEDLRNKRVELNRQIDRLSSRRMIQDRDHLLRDYLLRLLRHAKTMLEEAGLLKSTQLEYVLCVPVFWSEVACRTMHDAMVEAIRASSLGGLTQDLIPDLFIVSEPEAAAQYVIASLGSEERLRQGEVFIILDAGGGTVDITTYKVTSNELGPLRLQGEVVAPDGALCGSSLIKERYLRKVRAKVGEIDKDGDPELLDGAAIALANQWDMFQKPTIDVADRKTYFARFGPTKRYKGHPIHWKEDEIRDVFEDSLKGTTDLLERQIQLAKERKLIVSKLIVVGGFGDSPSLKSRIRESILKCCNSSGEEIDIIWPRDFPTSAVARGAVLRALDKRNGPDRISRSSFGFLRHEQYKDFDEHTEANVEPERDEVDHDNWVRNTIHWVIEAGKELPSPYQTEPIESSHTFEASEVKLVCVEKLYVSRKTHRSHFQFDHAVNDGASLLSYIEVDVSDLKKQFPLEDKTDVGPRTKVSKRSIRRVKFDLVIEVEGMQLKYEARWPPGVKKPEEVRVRKSGYISLAPSFAPGVK